jgi:hypothetical protein
MPAMVQQVLASLGRVKLLARGMKSGFTIISENMVSDACHCASRIGLTWL